VTTETQDSSFADGSAIQGDQAASLEGRVTTSLLVETNVAQDVTQQGPIASLTTETEAQNGQMRPDLSESLFPLSEIRSDPSEHLFPLSEMRYDPSEPLFLVSEMLSRPRTRARSHR
jgi:hypothetical protein